MKLKRNRTIKGALAAAAFAFALIGTVFSGTALAETRTRMALEFDGAMQMYDSPEITLVINGETLPTADLNMPPIIVDDRTYVPVRDVFEKMGALVDWKELTREVFIGYQDSLLILKIDDTNLYLDGEVVATDVAPKIINNRTMIPVKFASEAMGFAVKWEPDQKIVSLTDGSYIPEEQLAAEPVVAEAEQPVLPGAGSTPAAPNAGFEIGGALAQDVSKEEIPEENNPLTTVTHIFMPETDAGHTFRIAAAGAISKVKKLLLPDNRLIIDIYNAEIALPQSEYTPPGNVYLSRIRTGQNQVEPEMVARVVFDLSDAVNFSVALSEDRKEVLVSFEQNTIHNVIFSSDGVADYIRIEGESQPLTAIFPLTNPDRLVIDIPLGAIDETETPVIGAFSANLRTSQFEGHTARVVVDLTQTAAYEVVSEGVVTTVKITQPTYRNITYNAETGSFVIPKASGIVLDLNAVTQTDQYYNGQYIFSLSGDYSAIFGYGEYRISDAPIRSLSIQTVDGVTALCFNQNKILAYNLFEDENCIYIQPISPKQKYERIVVVDPGHGGVHTGTSGFGLREEHLNLDISLKLLRLLEADGRVKVYATRIADTHLHTDLSTDLLMRSAIGNNTGDLFVSIHNNSFSATSNGTETYYDNGNNTATGGVSQRLADAIQKNLLKELGSFDRKVQTSDFSVLRHATIPAVLAEIGFLSNAEEAAKLSADDYRARAAQAIFNAILETFETYTPAR